MTTTEERPLALVTGASSGIGFDLAREFAEHGYDLVVNAEDGGLDAAASKLRDTGATVRAVRVDLRADDAVERLRDAVRATGKPLAAAALNAGVGHGGPFVENDIEAEQAVIDVNITSTVRLAKDVLRDMVPRGEGKVLITSSIASTQPGSFQAVYNASKSFLQSFAEAVQDEVRDTGVTVTSLMPGPTETNFFHRADMDDTRVGRSRKDDPADVAKQGFAALMKGKGRQVAASVTTKVMAAGSAVLPDRVKAAIHRRMAEPGSGR